MDRTAFEAMLVSRLSRRQLLAGGLAVTLAISLPGRPTIPAGAVRRPVMTQPVFATSPFTLGIASGDPLPDSVVLWTRLAPDPLTDGAMPPVPVEVRWEIAREPAMADVVQRGTAMATPELAHSVHVDVTGLEPGRDYFYRFIAGAEISPVGRTRTAPAAGAPVDRLRLAVTSCAHWEHGFFAAYRHLAADDLDLVLHLGDYLYEAAPKSEFQGEGPPVRLHTRGETVTLADYRARHALYKTDPDLQLAHAQFPWVTVWDDHEVQNDYAGALSRDGQSPETFLARRAAAYQAYYEHLPLRPASLPAGPDALLYRRLTFGDLAEISVLDTRQYRTDQPCGGGVQPRCAAALDPTATLTGPAQERWLLDGLTATGARWNVIAQQVMMAQLDGRPGPAAIFSTDMWDGYPAARTRILDHLRRARTPNPVVLAGDVHSTWVNDLKADFTDPTSATIASEIVTTSVTSDNPYARQLPLLRFENRHARYFDARHGYTRHQLTPSEWRAEIRALPSALIADAPVETVATFVIDDGRPGAQLT